VPLEERDKNELKGTQTLIINCTLALLITVLAQYPVILIIALHNRQFTIHAALIKFTELR